MRTLRWRERDSNSWSLSRMWTAPSLSRVTSRYAACLDRACLPTRAGHPKPPRHTLAHGFRLTLRWTEPDSNHRSRSCERLFLDVANRRRRRDWRSHLQVEARDGNACLEWLPIALFANAAAISLSSSPSQRGARNSGGVTAGVRVLGAESRLEGVSFGGRSAVGPGIQPPDT